jgi:Xaa-Pro aminopeptidase
MKRLLWLSLMLSFARTSPMLHAQNSPYYQAHFPPEEFKARWGKIFEQIGDRAIAILQGMPQVNGFIFPRQNNEFYYLCGVETPHSYLVLDGRTRRVTLFRRRLDSACPLA